MFKFFPFPYRWASPALTGFALCAAPMKIQPGFQIVLSGEQAAWSAPDAEPCRWELVEPEGGAIDPAGRYTAPAVDAVRIFHIRAARGPGNRAEATVLVLPREPFGAGAPAGAGTSGPASPLPFLDQATDQRRGDDPLVQFWCPAGAGGATPRQIAGYGLPLVLRWPLRPGAAGALLSYREGGAWVRREVTGQGSAVLHPRERISQCAVEQLERSARCGNYLSFLSGFPVSVRGLLPLAGDPAAEGHGDGRGGTARFQEPHGMALVGCWQSMARQIIVADRASHVLRAISAEGEVTTPWGRPHEPGHQDGLGRTRFNGPTFVAAIPCESGPWTTMAGFLVADSGNQVIRRVDGAGAVATLAGTPGQAGFRDAEDPRLALFDDPRGLALDDRGDLYVADRGNHVIRRIDRRGAVTTLAGAPTRPGFQDGPGPQARFSALGGLALGRDQALYGADGHAVRRITLAGEVSTVLGEPERAGFRDGDGAGPCLDSPCALVEAAGHLTIADQGNRAIRDFDPATGILTTLAGDPALGENRFGLLRDGIPGPLGEAYAALAAPRGLAVGDQGELYVATGPCLGQLCRQRLAPPGPPVPMALSSLELAPGAPLAVEWTAPGPEGQPVLYTLAFIPADGAADRQMGVALAGGAVRAEGRFARPGPGRVVLQSVTGQGVSQGAQATVAVH